MARRLSPTERALAARPPEEFAPAPSRAVVPVDCGDLDVPLITHRGEHGRTVMVPAPPLERMPNLRNAFAAGLEARASGTRLISLQREIGHLSSFARFLAATGQADIGLERVDDDLLDRFREWLDDYEKVTFRHERIRREAVFRSEGGGRLATRSKQSLMDVVLAILTALGAMPEHRARLSADLDLHRGPDWATGGRRRPKPRPTLGRAQLKALVAICRREVERTTARLEAAWAAEGSDCASGDEEYAELRNLMRELAVLDAAARSVPPTRADLNRVFPGGSAACPALRRKTTDGFNASLELFYPTGRLLAPFLILFAVYFRYNPSVLAKLEPNDFSEQPSGFGPRIRGKPFKNRSDRTQYASWPVTADPHNPKRMLETLERWTARLRRLAPAGERNHVFLMRYSRGRVRTFENMHALATAMAAFNDEHEQALGGRFTLKSLRPAVLSLVHQLFDGDVVAAQVAGQHRRPETTVDHYLDDATMRHNEELLVPALHLRDRWIASGGVVDGREDRRQDRNAAATPGWDCRDPYHPPPEVAGQIAGRLCSAYGQCPLCPLGTQDLSSAEAFAFSIRLHGALLRSRVRMPEHAWLGRWAPVLDELERKSLRSFSDEIRRAGEALDLPPLPTVE